MTFSNTQSYLLADRLVDMNDIYKECISEITAKVQDFFWTWGDANTVTTQSEYEIGKFTFSDALTRDIVSVDGVSLKYKTGQDFKKLEKGDFSALDADFSTYTTWAGAPFYFVRDTSIFIAPNAIQAVTGGLRVYGNYRPLDLTLSDSITEIKIPLLYTKTIAYGMCMNYWMSQGNEQKASIWEKKYVEKKQKMIDNLSGRDAEIMGFITE